MMKQVLFTFFASTCAIFAQAQLEPLPKVDGAYGYAKIVTVDSMTKDALYTNARTFFANAFKSANDVIQLDDKEAGKIIGKGNLSVTGNQNKVMGQSWERRILANFTIEISCKDGRYRYSIYDITFKSYDQHTSRERAAIEVSQTIETLIEQAGSGTYKKATSEAYPKLLASFKALTDKIKQDMAKKSDW